MGALLIGQRDGGDGAGDVAGPLGGLAVEARVGANVRQGERLAGREHEPGDSLAGLDALADRSGTLWAGRHPELEPIRIGLEQGDGGRLRIEQAHGCVHDGLESRCSPLGSSRAATAVRRAPARTMARAWSSAWRSAAGGRSVIGA